MAGVTFDTIASRVVGIGYNIFEGGKINVTAGSTISAGTLLKRLANGNFAVAGASDAPIAVMPFDLVNTGTVAADMGFRALVSGQVRKDMLTLGGAAITKAQGDALRDYGIIAVDSVDMSRTGV
jgi:hypothetical protein